MRASNPQVDLDRIEQAAKAAAEATGQLGTQARFSIGRLEAQRQADKCYRELGQYAEDLVGVIAAARQGDTLRQEVSDALVEAELLRSENARLAQALQEQSEQLQAVNAKAIAADEAHEANARLTEERDILASENARLASEVARLRQAIPDDLRAAGWCLAVHSDHQLGDEAHTSWVFIKGDRCLTGKGRTDAEALEQARELLPAAEA